MGLLHNRNVLAGGSAVFSEDLLSSPSIQVAKNGITLAHKYNSDGRACARNIKHAFIVLKTDCEGRISVTTSEC